MLPFENRSWAKPAARSILLFTVVALSVFAYLIARIRPLDVPEIALIVIVLLGVLPPNIAILRRKRHTLPPSTSSAPAESGAKA